MKVVLMVPIRRVQAVHWEEFQVAHGQVKRYGQRGGRRESLLVKRKSLSINVAEVVQSDPYLLPSLQTVQVKTLNKQLNIQESELFAFLSHSGVISPCLTLMNIHWYEQESKTIWDDLFGHWKTKSA